MSMMNLGEICCTFVTYVYVPVMNLLEERDDPILYFTSPS